MFGIEEAPAEPDAAAAIEDEHASDAAAERALPAAPASPPANEGTSAVEVAERASLDVLPDDVALEVLLRLPALARLTLACCSPRWRRLVATEQLWLRVSLDGLRVLRPDDLRRLLARAQPLGGPLALDFGGAARSECGGRSRGSLRRGNEAVAALAAAPAAPDQLRMLRCADAAALTPRAVTALAAACPDLARGSELTVLYGTAWEHDLDRLRFPAGCDVRLAAADEREAGDVAQPPWPARLDPPTLPTAPGQQPACVTLHLAVEALARSGARLVAIETYLKERTAAAPQVRFAHMQQHGGNALASLRALDLRGCHAGPSGGTELAMLLSAGACPELQTLNLSHAAFVNQQLLSAAAALPTLTCLDLSHNVLGEAGADAVAAGLIAASANQEGRTSVAGAGLRLDLSRCNLRDTGVARLARAMERGAAVESLLLHGNSLTDEGATALAAAMRRGFGVAHARCNPLQALSLADNAIRAGGAAALAAAFQDGALSSLTRLDMHNTLLGPDGAAALAGALALPAARCALRSLDMSSCKAGDGGVAALAAALRRNATLCELDILENDIGDDGVHALAAALHAAGGEGEEDGAGGECVSMEEDCDVSNTALQVLHVGRVRASGAAMHALRLATRRLHRCWL